MSYHDEVFYSSKYGDEEVSGKLIERSCNSVYYGPMGKHILPTFTIVIFLSTVIGFSSCSNREEYSVNYLFASHCNSCTDTEKRLVGVDSEFRKNNSDYALKITMLNVMIPAQYDPAMEIIDSMDIPSSAKNLPLLISGDHWFYGEDDINAAISSLEAGRLP
ncbi:MAG: hypothetical protein JEY99_01230 [Spirochaetales bacterium]|nr:hypothetical protein [Spirochaetales bacterium]